MTRSTRNLVPDRQQSRQLAMVLSMCLLLLVSLLDPRFPHEQLLQHVPTVPSLAIIILGVRRGWWSTLAVFCLMLFAFFHIIGARFIYTEFPYDQIIRNLTGWSIDKAFGFQRNHYDRFVHLLFGIVMPLPVAELIARRNPISPMANLILTVSFLAGISGVYEILEWLVAVVMSPEMAESYNGQQGDMWDAQKDMALALLGSLIVAVPVWRRLQGRPDVSESHMNPGKVNP